MEWTLRYWRYRHTYILILILILHTDNPSKTFDLKTEYLKNEIKLFHKIPFSRGGNLKENTQ